MAFYATYRDYCRVNKIDFDQPTENEKLSIIAYLRTAITAIDTMTRRRFAPDYQTRMYQVPVLFADLRNRAMIFDDLTLDRDLLEPQYVKTGGNSLIRSGETVPLAGLTAAATSFIAQNVNGEDENGGIRFAPGDILQIGDERLIVAAANSATHEVHVFRAALETAAMAHAAGAVIYKMNLVTFARGIDYQLLSFNTYPKYGLRPSFPNAWGGRYLGGGWADRYPNIFVIGFWGYHEQYTTQAWVDTLETVPLGGLSSSATTITLVNADGRDNQNNIRIEEGYLLRIDDELIEVTAVDYATNVAALLRGQRGTLARAHSASTQIFRWATQPDIVEAAISMAKTWREADDSVGGRQGVSEMSQGVEIQIPSGILGMLNRYVRSIT